MGARGEGDDGGLSPVADGAAFGFRTATEIRFGRGVAAEAAPRIAALGRRVMLVGGGTPARTDWLAEALAAAGVEVVRFACPAEPDLALIEAGRAAGRAARIDAVAACGGGSAIDAGKALAALVPAPGPVLDHLEVVGRGLPLVAPPLPFVAIPTTAGTGAEVTRNAVIGVAEARRKVSLRDDRMLARLALVDPALTDDLGRAVTLASGLDAVTQVIEPYLSRRANRLTDALCRAAIPAGLAALARLMEVEDPQARDDLAWTSLAGGLALANAGLGVVHGLAGPIGGLAGAPHGAICGALLPHALDANAAAAPEGVARRIVEVRGWIEAAIGPDLAAFTARYGLPRLGAMGLARGDVAAAAEAAEASSSMRGNPVDLSREALVSLVNAAL